MFNAYFFSTLFSFVETIENRNLQSACKFVISDLEFSEKYFFENIYTEPSESWWDSYFEDIRRRAYYKMNGIEYVAEYGSSDEKTIKVLEGILFNYVYAPTFH